jgi:hypothetical protein
LGIISGVEVGETAGLAGLLIVGEGNGICNLLLDSPNGEYSGLIVGLFVAFGVSVNGTKVGAVMQLDSRDNSARSKKLFACRALIEFTKIHRTIAIDPESPA